MRVEEPFSISGYFWLPSDEENKLYGTLTVEDGGKVELEILGNFNKDINESFNNDADIERIIGRTENGYVTLEKCYFLTSNLKIGVGLAKNRILVSVLYKDVVYEENKVILFDTLSFTVDGLNEWLNIRKIKIEEDVPNRKFVIRNEELENYIFTLNKDITLKFEISLSIDFNHYQPSMKQSSTIKLISNEKQPFDYFTKTANKIVKFLSFAIDESINIKNIYVTNDANFRECSTKKHPVPIQVYSQVMNFFKDTPEIKFHAMLFQYTDIQESFEEKINSWLDAYNVIKPALNLFFAVRYNPNQYIESEFLSLAQALETYHRQLYGGNKTLKDRLKEIIEPFHEYIGTNEEVEEFIDNIKVSRNYYTHYDDRLINRAIPCEELTYLSRKMEGVLQLAFLTQIGFDTNEIHKIFHEWNGLKDKF